MDTSLQDFPSKINPGGHSTAAKQKGLATIPNKIVNFSSNSIARIKIISITDG